MSARADLEIRGGGVVAVDTDTLRAAAGRFDAVRIELDDKAKEFLAAKGFDPLYGARPMRRAVERFLEDPLAEDIIRGNLHENDPILVTVEGDKLVFTQPAAAAGAGAVA